MLSRSSLLLWLLSASAAFAAESLFVAKPFTREGEFTKGIEGPAVDRHGTVFAVNFGAEQTIGKVSPNGKAELFVTLPGKGVGNGIRFGSDGSMYVADYVEHRVLKVDPATRAIRVFASEPAMNQPNDLAITDKDVLYASDPDWKGGKGHQRCVCAA